MPRSLRTRSVDSDTQENGHTAMNAGFYGRRHGRILCTDGETAPCLSIGETKYSQHGASLVGVRLMGWSCDGLYRYYGACTERGLVSRMVYGQRCEVLARSAAEPKTCEVHWRAATVRRRGTQPDVRRVTASGSRLAIHYSVARQAARLFVSQPSIWDCCQVTVYM